MFYTETYKYGVWEYRIRYGKEVQFHRIKVQLYSNTNDLNLQGKYATYITAHMYRHTTRSQHS